MQTSNTCPPLAYFKGLINSLSVLIGGKLFVNIGHLMNDDCFHGFKGEKKPTNLHFKRAIKKCINLSLYMIPHMVSALFVIPLMLLILNIKVLNALLMRFGKKDRPGNALK